MSSVIGLEIGATSIRGVALSGFGLRTSHSAEVEWDGSDATVALASLQRQLGPASQIGVAIGLAYLHVSRVELPATGFNDRESMLALEPERYFATTEPLVTALAPRSSIAFGAPSEWLDSVVGQIAAWGPVSRVEPLPLSLARGTESSSSFACEGGTVLVAHATVTGVRRSSGSAEEPVSSTRDPFVAARLVGTGIDDPLDGTLMRAPERGAVSSRRWRGIAVAAVAAVAGIVFCGAAWDQSRDRYLAVLDAHAARLAEEVRPALEAQATMMLGLQEVALLTERETQHTRVAETLAAISSVVPGDVVFLNARMRGTEWQLDGTARDAAVLVPLFDKDPRFDNIRTLAASTRFRDGNRTRESFSIALHVK